MKHIFLFYLKKFVFLYYSFYDIKNIIDNLKEKIEHNYQNLFKVKSKFYSLKKERDPKSSVQPQTYQWVDETNSIS